MKGSSFSLPHVHVQVAHGRTHRAAPQDGLQAGAVTEQKGRSEVLVDIIVIVFGQSELLQVIAALRAASRFAGCLHGRQQQRNQDGNDGNHYQ
jgi:hypothetical protein